MEFGKVTNAAELFFSLPKDSPENRRILPQQKTNEPIIYVGCAKWGSDELRYFYPTGWKKQKELGYYSSQLNSVELNSTWHSIPSEEQVKNWYVQSDANFRFFPKLNRDITHGPQGLTPSIAQTQLFLDRTDHFQEKREMIFMQLPDGFSTHDWPALKDYITRWPESVPLALELRDKSWFDNSSDTSFLYSLLEERQIPLILTDTAGRRDVLHMRLTTTTAFIRYTGANVDSDYTRLDEWAERLKLWVDQGLEKVYFFVHQNKEEKAVQLAAHFIQKLNTNLRTTLKIPRTQEVNILPDLFGNF